MDQGERVAEAAELVPPWLANLAALAWRLVVIAVLAVVVWLLAMLLATVTAAISLAIVVSAVLVPATRQLRARGRSRSAAAAITWTLAMLVGIGVLVVLAIVLIPQIADMVATAQAGRADLERRLAEITVPPFVGAALGLVVDAALAIVGGAVAAAVESAAAVLTSLVLATFLVFFFLRDGDRAWTWVLQAVAADKRARVTAAGMEAIEQVGGYLVGTTVLSAVVALSGLVFMLVLGVPFAVPLALLTFLGGYIPYFGRILATLVVLLVTLAALGPTGALVMLVLVLGRDVALAYGVRRWARARTVRLHPALVLVALPAGYQLAGVVGLFAAVPLAAVVLAVADAVVAVVSPERPPRLPALVPAWLDRVAQWSWRILAAAALVGLAIAIFTLVPLVLIPVVLGVILAATFAPVVEAVEARGWSRAPAIALVLGGSFIAIAVMLLLAVGALVGEGAAVASSATQGASRLSEAAGGNLGLLTQAVDLLGRAGEGTLAAIVGQAAAIAVVSLLSGLLCFYFLRDGGTLWRRVIGQARPGQAVEIEATGRRSFEVLGGYMYGTAIVSLAGAASQLAIMLLLGIPLAVPVFVLSFFLCFIPYIGGFISTGAALLLTISTGDPLSIAVMAVWTLLFNIVTGNVVSPIVYGRTVHLHPAVVLVAIPIGSTIAGILGMLLVVPAMGVIAVSWRTVLRVMAGDRDAAAASGG